MIPVRFRSAARSASPAGWMSRQPDIAEDKWLGVCCLARRTRLSQIPWAGCGPPATREIQRPEFFGNLLRTLSAGGFSRLRPRKRSVFPSCQINRRSEIGPATTDNAPDTSHISGFASSVGRALNEHVPASRSNDLRARIPAPRSLSIETTGRRVSSRRVRWSRIRPWMDTYETCLPNSMSVVKYGSLRRRCFLCRVSFERLPSSEGRRQGPGREHEGGDQPLVQYARPAWRLADASLSRGNLIEACQGLRIKKPKLGGGCRAPTRIACPVT